MPQKSSWAPSRAGVNERGRKWEWIGITWHSKDTWRPGTWTLHVFERGRGDGLPATWQGNSHKSGLPGTRKAKFASRASPLAHRFSDGSRSRTWHKVTHQRGLNTQTATCDWSKWLEKAVTNKSHKTRLLGLVSDIKEYTETSDEQSTFSCQVHSAYFSGRTYKVA